MHRAVLTLLVGLMLSLGGGGSAIGMPHDDETVCSRATSGAPPVWSSINLLYVEEAVKRLRHLVFSMPSWTSLQHFLPPNLSKPMDIRSATASHFAASLELAREGVLTMRQGSHFAPIYLKTREQI